MAQKADKFVMRVDPAFIEKIDEWRRTQPDLPNRSEAVRRLVETAMAKPEDSYGRVGELFRDIISSAEEREELFEKMFVVGLDDRNLMSLREYLKNLRITEGRIADCLVELDRIIGPEMRKPAKKAVEIFNEYLKKYRFPVDIPKTPPTPTDDS